jgi:integrase
MPKARAGGEKPPHAFGLVGGAGEGHASDRDGSGARGKERTARAGSGSLEARQVATRPCFLPGVPRFHFFSHRLRDLAGLFLACCGALGSSYLEAAGISAVRADRYMGHSSSSMRARYTHQLEAQLAEDAETLNAYLVAGAAGKVVPLRTGAQAGAQVAQTA